MEFTLHPNNKKYMNGLNLIGCDSTIKTKDDNIWKFEYFSRQNVYPTQYYYKNINNNNGKWFTKEEVMEADRVILTH